MSADIGTQTGALGVSPKVHTQLSTGKPVTASMEAYSKLTGLRREAAPRSEQVQSVLGTISQEDAAEIIAGLDLRTETLANRVDEGKAYLEGIKESQDPKIAKLTALIPAAKGAEGELSYITKGQYREVWGREPKQQILTADGKRVRWEYALDEIAQELHLEPIAQAAGKAPDEYLKELIEEARDTKREITAVEHEVASDERTLKALDKLKDTVKARIGATTNAELVESYAKPKVKPKTKPERVAQGMLAAEAQKLIDKVQKSRTPQAIAMDSSLRARRVLPMSKAQVWARQPNRYDIRGIDTPGRRSTKKKSRPTARRAKRTTPQTSAVVLRK